MDCGLLPYQRHDTDHVLVFIHIHVQSALSTGGLWVGRFVYPVLLKGYLNMRGNSFWDIVVQMSFLWSKLKYIHESYFFLRVILQVLTGWSLFTPQSDGFHQFYEVYFIVKRLRLIIYEINSTFSHIV